jgi:hypothetical protein
MIAKDSMRKQLNVRISVDLHDKIESSEKGKQDTVIEALELYFDSNGASNHKANDNKDASKQDKNDSGEHASMLIAAFQAELDHLRVQNIELTRLLSQEQTLHLQTQRLLPAHTMEERKWWQVWKRVH